jgi:hypothetical protein
MVMAEKTKQKEVKMEELKKDIALLEEAIKHQIRMEEWVRTQNPRKKPDPDEMYRNIRENWFALSCPLCMAFFNECEKCVLAREATGCQKNSEWFKMDDSKTWKQWLRRSREFRSVMEKIKEKLEKKLEKIN